MTAPTHDLCACGKPKRVESVRCQACARADKMRWPFHVTPRREPGEVFVKGKRVR